MALFTDSYGVITRVGKAAVIAAGTSGPVIQITSFKIGSLSANEGATANIDDSTIDSVKYTGTSSDISYAVLGEDSCKFTIVLGENVGDFDVGQIGLYTSGGVLFAKCVLPKKSAKWRTNAPAQIGNTKSYDIILVLPSIESCIDLTILRSNYASLPEVPTEADLPDANTTVYSTYLVRNHTEIGVACIASRRNGSWFFAPERLVAGAGQSVVALTSAAFDSSVKINMAVYYDSVTKTFKPADASDTTGLKYPCGVRSSTFELTLRGPIKRYADDDVWPSGLILNTWLYVQSGASVGKPATTATWAPYGFVTGADMIWVDYSFAYNAFNGKTITDTAPLMKSHRHPNVTTSYDGFMSIADFVKLANPETFVIGSQGINTAALSGGRVSVTMSAIDWDDTLADVLRGRQGIRVVHDTINNLVYVENDIGTGVRNVAVP